MQVMKIDIVTDGGPWAEHNYPCPVYTNCKAVLDLDKGIFQPSWIAQKHGYHIIHANTWIKRLIYKWVFTR